VGIGPYGRGSGQVRILTPFVILRSASDEESKASWRKTPSEARNDRNGGGSGEGESLSGVLHGKAPAGGGNFVDADSLNLIR